MTDTDGLDEAFKGFGEDPAPVTPPVADPVTPPVEPPATAPVDPPIEPPKKEDSKPPVEEPKKEEKKDEPAEPSEGTEPPKADDKKTEEVAKPPETPETPPAPEEPKPLTKDDVKEVVTDLLSGERNSGKELETTAKEVLDAYYPDGLSNVLVDEKSGKELRTPADVVEASGDEMSTEEAAQWLMNEQFRLDNQVNQIKNDAKAIAETTVNFRRDSITAIQKYEPLFKQWPVLQQKTFDKLMKQVKVDKEKGVVLSAPDVMEFYDDALEPYQLAFEHDTKTAATSPTPPPGGEPPKPTAEDRMDEGGDGSSAGEVNDPNDFPQQVRKELAKELQIWKIMHQKVSVFSILKAARHATLGLSHKFKVT